MVVGAGSAGCAMAFRLAEAGRSVIVVEHGGSDAGPLIRMPGALSFPMGMARYDWGYRTEPEPHLGGRVLAAPRGKVVGGSSSINGMVWVRGHPRDYDGWAEAGATGWAWSDVEPYFRRIEAWEDGGRGGDPALRGRDGPMRVGRGPGRDPLVSAFFAAGEQAGHPLTPDHNGAQQEGFGPFDATIWRGRRWSAADGYLRPARRLGARLIRGLVERVVIEDGRATGVAIATRGGPVTVRARAEVILSAGPFNSPKLLMLSGIGPGAELARHGIAVLADRPGVGANLQDHLEVYVQMAGKGRVGLYRHWSLWGKALVGARWLLTRRGPGASNQFEGVAFLRSRPEVEWPDIQFHFLPLAVRYDGRGAMNGFQVHAGTARSPSRGRVWLRSADARAAPRIRFDYMSRPEDWRDFRAAIRLAREVFAQPAFAPFAAGESAPGPQVQTEDEIDAFVREHAESAYHPCGTCRMGPRDDPKAVVDREGRVIGLERLRIADSSVIPRITNGNLNAPSILVGEKMADHVLGRTPPS